MAASEADGEITVLSAGAPKTGVSRCAEAFAEARGRRVAVTFATAPAIRERMQGGDRACDVVIAPVPAMEEFKDAGRIVADSTVVIGKIEAGVVVRNGAPTPDVATVESLRTACREADSLVYNEASSGQRIAETMVHLGIAGEVADKTVRVPTGRAVMEHLAQGTTARETGFGQVTEIRLHADKGVRLVGTLPKGVAIVTTYAAGVVSEASDVETARAFIAFMDTPHGRAILADAGLD